MYICRCVFGDLVLLIAAHDVHTAMKMLNEDDMVTFDGYSTKYCQVIHSCLSAAITPCAHISHVSKLAGKIIDQW